jgi:hypothetical protein
VRRNSPTFYEIIVYNEETNGDLAYFNLNLNLNLNLDRSPFCLSHLNALTFLCRDGSMNHDVWRLDSTTVEWTLMYQSSGMFYDFRGKRQAGCGVVEGRLYYIGGYSGRLSE